MNQKTFELNKDQIEFLINTATNLKLPKLKLLTYAKKYSFAFMQECFSDWAGMEILNDKSLLLAIKNKIKEIKEIKEKLEAKQIEEEKNFKKPVKKTKAKPKKELKTINTTMRDYGLSPEQRNYLFDVSNFVGMQSHALYNFAEKYGFNYINETIAICNERDKITIGNPGYLIAAIKNDYWNLREPSKFEHVCDDSCREVEKYANEHEPIKQSDESYIYHQSASTLH